MDDKKFFYRRVLVFSLVIIGLVVIVFALFNNSSDVGKNGPETFSPETPANIVYNKSPYRTFTDNVPNSLLANDLMYFARHTLPAYDVSKKEFVNFTISDKPVRSGTDVHFVGKFDKSKDKIDVKVTLLANGRIDSKITDMHSNKNIDSELPSKSKENKYIASLPIRKPSYIIYYSPDSLKITVKITGTYSAQLKQEALKQVSDALGSDYINDSKVDFYYTLPSSISETNTVVQGSVLN